MENNYYRATVWTLAHALMFSSSGIFVKLLAPQISTIEQIFYRSAFVVMMVLIFYRPSFSECFKPAALPSLIARGLFGFCGICSMFYVITELPLAIAMVLTLTTPVFLMIFSRFSMNEKIRLSQIAPALLTLIGVAFLLDLNFSEGLETNLPLFPVLIGLLSSLLAALAFLSIRSALQMVGPSIVVFWFALISTIGAGAIAGKDLTMPTGDSLYFLMILCVLGLLSDVTKTTAYKYAVAWFVSLVTLATIAFSMILGWAIFDEYMRPIQLFGVAVVIAGITTTILISRTRES